MFKMIKDNKKSTVYENDKYRVKVSEIPGYFLKRNGADYVDYDDELEDDDYKFTEAVKLEVTNIETGKTSSKRCYQGFGVIDDVEEDIKSGKKQFNTIFKKIDG